MPRTRLPRTAQQRQATLLVLLGLVAFVGLVFSVVVLGGGMLLGQTDTPHPALSIGATVLVALTFDRVQRTLDRWATRRTHGGTQSPYEVLTALSERLRSTVSADDLPARLARVLAEGTGAVLVQIWLDVGGALTEAATWPPAVDAEGHPGALPRATSSSGGPPPGRALRSTASPDGVAPSPAAGPGIRTVEVRHAGDLLGAIVLHEAEGRSLTPVEERLVAGLAAQAGLLLHGVRLHAARERRLEELSARAVQLQDSRARVVAARDEERRRLERDIHDGAQQHLVALAVNLRLAQALVTRSPERSAEVLTAQAAAARQTVDTVLRLARGTYPSVLTDRGLAAALEAAARANAVPVDVETRDLGRYPADVEAAVYFSCLEALQNAAKHSRARRVTVRLLGESDALDVTVDDDGRGFPPAAAARGAGLANIRDRIDAVGGEVELGRAPGGGARVRLRVPLAPAGAS